MVAEQVEAVVPAAEHGAALLQEQGVVHPQRQGHAGAGQLHSWHTGVSGLPCWLSVDHDIITFGHELHGLGAVAESASPAVAAGEDLAAPRQEAGVELLQDHAGDVHRVLAETLHDVRLQSDGCRSVQSNQFPEECHLLVLFPSPRLKLELVPHT